jgi:hypothetical protein
MRGIWRPGCTRSKAAPRAQPTRSFTTSDAVELKRASCPGAVTGGFRSWPIRPSSKGRLLRDRVLTAVAIRHNMPEALNYAGAVLIPHRILSALFLDLYHRCG